MRDTLCDEDDECGQLIHLLHDHEPVRGRQSGHKKAENQMSAAPEAVSARAATSQPLTISVVDLNACTDLDNLLPGGKGDCVLHAPQGFRAPRSERLNRLKNIKRQQNSMKAECTSSGVPMARHNSQRTQGHTSLQESKDAHKTTPQSNSLIRNPSHVQQTRPAARAQTAACPRPAACTQPAPCPQPEACPQPAACPRPAACTQPAPCPQPEACPQPAPCPQPEACPQPEVCSQPANNEDPVAVPDAPCSGASTLDVSVDTTSQPQQTVGQVASLVSRFRTAPPRARKQRYLHADDAPSCSFEQPREPADELQAVQSGDFASPTERPENTHRTVGDTGGLVVCQSAADSDRASAIHPGCGSPPSGPHAHMLDGTASLQSVASVHSMTQSAVVHTVSQLRTAPPRRTICLSEQRQLSKEEALHQPGSLQSAAAHPSEVTCAAALAADRHTNPLCTDVRRADLSAQSTPLIAACGGGAGTAIIPTCAPTVPLLHDTLGSPAPGTSMRHASVVGEVSVQGTGEDDSVSELLKRCRNILSARKSTTDSVVTSSHGSPKMLASTHAGADLHERLKRLLQPATDHVAVVRQSGQPADAAQAPGADLLREWRDNKHTLRPLDTSIRVPLVQDCVPQTRPVTTAAADIKARLNAILRQSTSSLGGLSAASAAAPMVHSQVSHSPSCGKPGFCDAVSASDVPPQGATCAPEPTQACHTSEANPDISSPAATLPLPHSGDVQPCPSSLQLNLSDITSVPPQGVAAPSDEVSQDNLRPCSISCCTPHGGECATPAFPSAGGSESDAASAQQTVDPSGQPEPAQQQSECDAEGQPSPGPDTHSVDEAPACLSPDCDVVRCSGRASAVQSGSHSPDCSQASSRLSETMEHILDGMFQSESSGTSPCQSPTAAVSEAASKPLSPPVQSDSPQRPQRSRVDRIMACARSEVIDSVSSCNEDAPCKHQNDDNSGLKANAIAGRLCTPCDNGTPPGCRPGHDNTPRIAVACEGTLEEQHDGHSRAPAAVACSTAARALQLPGPAQSPQSPTATTGSSQPSQSQFEPATSHGIDTDVVQLLPPAPEATSLDVAVLRSSCDDVCEGVDVATNGGRSRTSSTCTPSPPSVPPPEHVACTVTPATSHEHCAAAWHRSGADRYDAVDVDDGQLHTYGVHLLDSEPDESYCNSQQVSHQLPPWVEDEVPQSPCTMRPAPSTISPGSTALTELAEQQGNKLHGVSAGDCPWEEGPRLPLADGVSIAGSGTPSDVLHEQCMQDCERDRGCSAAASPYAVTSVAGSLPARHALLPALKQPVDGSMHGEGPQKTNKDTYFQPAREQACAHPGVENIASLEDWLQRKGRLARWAAGDLTPVEGLLGADVAFSDDCGDDWHVGDASLHGLLVQDTQVFGPATVGDSHVHKCWQSIHRMSHDLRDSSRAGE